MSLVKEGVVVEGEYFGWRILIDDDRDGETGGYYLYLKKDDVQGFDYWFEYEVGLQSQLSNFNIEWVD